MDQATSLSLISSSQEQCHGNTVGTLFTAIADRENKAPGPNTAESSPSLISHSQDYGLKVTEESFRIGDIVEIHMRTTKNGSVSHRGMVTETDVNRPDRVKTDTYLRYFRRVLKLIHRPSTSMSSIGSQSDSECAISQYC